MTTASHAFLSTAAPRSIRATWSGVRPRVRAGFNSSSVQAMVGDVLLHRRRDLAIDRAPTHDVATDRARRHVGRAIDAHDHFPTIEARGVEVRRLRRAAAGTGNHHDRRQPADLVRRVPCSKRPGRVQAEDEEQIGLRMQLMESAQRVRRERRPRAPQLEVGDCKALVAGRGQPGHLEPVVSARGRHGPVWRLPGRHEQHAVELCTLDRRAGRRQVPDMDGVEGSAENADPLAGRAHGWYSNSVSATRTVSPGLTPALSRASPTPMRSSSAWKRSRDPSDSRLVRSTRFSTRSPRTANPHAVRSTTSPPAPATRSFTFAGGASRTGSGAEAIAATIASRSSGRPSPVSADTKWTPLRRDRLRMPFVASRSSLFTATMWGRRASSGEKLSTSADTAARSFHGSAPEPSTTYTNTRVRSAWRRNRWPRPAPRDAPSTSPGISAITKRPPADSATPSAGSSVVNG